MKYEELTELMMALYNSGDRTPITLLGPPGIGKTSGGRQLATMMGPGAISRVLDLSSMLPEDLLGLPYRDGGVTKYAPQEWLAELCEPDAFGVIVIDDLPAASPALQVAARQLVLERRVHEHSLAEGIAIVVTGNRRQDKSSASTLPAHFLNSVCVLQIEPDLAGWLDWYAKQKDCSPMISAFLSYRPVHLSYTPGSKVGKGEGRVDPLGAFATPRTWAMLGRMFTAAEKVGSLLDVSYGCIGESVGCEFMAFVKVKSQLVNPEEVLKDPEGAMPNPRESINSPDKVYAMVVGLAEVAAQREWPLRFLVALGHVTGRNEEFLAVGLNAWKQLGQSIASLVKAARDNREDPNVKSVVAFLLKVSGV